jgi:hypothetical protein
MNRFLLTGLEVSARVEMIIDRRTLFAEACTHG